MISWIQRSFQHHFRVVFGVLLAVTIISFIFTIGASPGIGRAGPKTYSQLFFGHDLSRQGASESLYGDAALSVQLQAGFMPRESAQVQEYGLQRIAALALADQLKIPAILLQSCPHFFKRFFYLIVLHSSSFISFSKTSLDLYPI